MSNKQEARITRLKKTIESYLKGTDKNTQFHDACKIAEWSLCELEIENRYKAENEQLKKQVKILREALKPLAHLDLTGVRGEIVYQRDNTKITVTDVTAAKKLLTDVS